MAGIDEFAPGKAFGLGALLAGVNPKNLLLRSAPRWASPSSGSRPADAVVSLIVFVVVGSLTIAAPVIYYLLGGQQAKTAARQWKGWLAAHNAAVMIALFLVFGVDLIAKGLAPLTS